MEFSFIGTIIGVPMVISHEKQPYVRIPFDDGGKTGSALYFSPADNFQDYTPGKKVFGCTEDVRAYKTKFGCNEICFFNPYIQFLN